MSTKVANAKTNHSEKTPPAPELGQVMPGSDILVRALEREGVECIFAYPGGASMEIHQALTRSTIRTILPRHEQGGAFAAGGYARATGRPGVCMATSGPGATNLVTGIADAYMDSVPLVAITGQVPQSMIGKGAFQETDFFGMTLPVVKHSYLITDINDIPRIVKEAFYIARTGRPGPVVIDFPKNFQQAKTQPVWPAEVHLRGYNPDKRADDLALNEIIGLIEKAERPGALLRRRHHHRRRRGGIAAVRRGDPNSRHHHASWAAGRFPETHPLVPALAGHARRGLRQLGRQRRIRASQKPGQPMVKLKPGADLLLAFGVRFDDRVTGKVDEFCKTGTIVHIDIDQSEHNKNRKVQLAIESDIKYALGRLNEMIRRGPIQQEIAAWRAQIAEWKARAPFHYGVTKEVVRSEHMRDHLQGRESEVILPQMAIEMLYELTQGEAIITTGVGQHQMWAGQYYKFTRPRQFLTSAGLGAMGFGYPAALGAKVACPDKQVIDIDGDGSFLMNVQELATAHIEKIAAKVMILNNQHLGMVVQWEDNFYQGNRGHTYLGDPEQRRQIYPDYVAMARSFNVPRRARHV